MVVIQQPLYTDRVAEFYTDGSSTIRSLWLIAYSTRIDGASPTLMYVDKIWFPDKKFPEFKNHAILTYRLRTVFACSRLTSTENESRSLDYSPLVTPNEHYRGQLDA